MEHGTLKSIWLSVFDILDKTSVRGTPPANAQADLHALADDWTAAGGSEAVRAAIRKTQSTIISLNAYPEGAPEHRALLPEILERKREMYAAFDPMA